MCSDKHAYCITIIVQTCPNTIKQHLPKKTMSTFFTRVLLTNIETYWIKLQGLYIVWPHFESSSIDWRNNGGKIGHCCVWMSCVFCFEFLFMRNSTCKYQGFGTPSRTQLTFSSGKGVFPRDAQTCLKLMPFSGVNIEISWIKGFDIVWHHAESSSVKSPGNAGKMEHCGV